MNKNNFRLRTVSAIITIAVIVCVFVLNAISGLVSQKFPFRIDLTNDRIYEFSQQTVNVMQGLKEDVTAYALIPPQTSGEYIDYIREYLSSYERLSTHFKAEYIDPYTNPAFMQKYNDGEFKAEPGSVILECGDNYKILALEQMYIQNSYNGDIETDMERKVTNALMNITEYKSKNSIAFLNGHSKTEYRLLYDYLSDDGYETVFVNLSLNEIPQSTALAVLVSPETDLTESEHESLDRYLDGGGRMLLVAGPQTPRLARLEGLLKKWGISLNYDYVIEADQSRALSAGGGVPIPAPYIEEHPASEKIMNSQSVFVSPNSMSLTLTKSRNSSQTTPLLKTSPSAYGKVNLSSSVTREEGDRQGPLTISAISELFDGNKGAVAVIGSLHCIETKGMLTEGAYLNGDFVLNLTQYLCGNNADMGIRAKKISPEIMTMTENQINTIIALVQYIIPLTILIIGLSVWLRRRYK